MNNDTVKIHATWAIDHGGRIGRTAHTFELPAWCSGDPAAAVALYLFGYADAVGAYKIIARVES